MGKVISTIVMVLLLVGAALGAFYTGIFQWNMPKLVVGEAPAEKAAANLSATSNATATLKCGGLTFKAVGKGTTESAAEIQMPDGWACQPPKAGPLKVEVINTPDVKVVKMPDPPAPPAPPVSPIVQNEQPPVPANVDMARYYAMAQKCGINRQVPPEERPKVAGWLNGMSKSEFDNRMSTCKGALSAKRPRAQAPAADPRRCTLSDTVYVNGLGRCIRVAPAGRR